MKAFMPAILLICLLFVLPFSATANCARRRPGRPCDVAPSSCPSCYFEFSRYLCCCIRKLLSPVEYDCSNSPPCKRNERRAPNCECLKLTRDLCVDDPPPNPRICTLPRGK